MNTRLSHLLFVWIITTLSVVAQPYGLTSRPAVSPYLDARFPAAPRFPGLPLLLSQTGVFADTSSLTPSAAMIPYTINAALWSDAASKSRWMIIPTTDVGPIPGIVANGTQIGFNASGELTFPLGSVFVKHFDLVTNEVTGSKRRLETRVLVRNSFSGSGVYGVTYKWNATETDATLLFDGLDEVIKITTATGSRQQTWHYPSQAQCLQCHTPASGGVLGVKTRQLKRQFAYPGTGVTDNQLRALNHIGLFTPALSDAAISTFAKTVSLNDTSATLEDRVRSYLDANCAHCHRPGGPGKYFDARYDTPLASQNLVDNSYPLIRFQDVDGSRVHARAAYDGGPMPPLGRNIADPAFLAVLSDWINNAFGVTAATLYGDSSTIRIKFNHPVDPATASVTGNYAIYLNISDHLVQASRTVLSATVGPDPAMVTLQISPTLYASNDYAVKINNVRDALSSPETIWPNSTRNFSGTAQAVGDNFGDSVRILSRTDSSSYTMNGSNQTATKEKGEPNHAGNSGGKSVWWNWTAPSNVRAAISTRGSDFNTLLAVYTGGSLGSLIPVASNDDSEGQPTSTLRFDAVQGTLYQIAVDGYNGASGNILLQLDLGNNDFAARLPVPSGELFVTRSGSNAGASKEANEPNHAGNAGGHSVWWSWVAVVTSSVTIDTTGSDFDTLLAVYTGTSVNALTPVASNDNDSANRTSQVTFTAVKGTVYQIAVDGRDGASGNILLNLALTNDTFDKRTVLPNSGIYAGPYSITLTGSNEAAGKESNEPNHAGNAGGRSVWYYWAAPFFTPVTITAAGSDFDTLLAVYQGSSLSNLVEVASNDDELAGGVKTSRVKFTPQAHTPYQIAVDGKNGASGKITLTVSQNVPPKVSIVAPADQAAYNEDDAIILAASALDVDGSVSKVEYFLPGSADGFFAPLKLGEALVPPYLFTWNDVPANVYSIIAVATDNEGAQTTSQPISVAVHLRAIIKTNNPPTVSITAPANGGTFTALSDITITADARDSNGTISKVDFYEGANLIGTVTASPFSSIWRRVPSGTYSITAKATDNQNATATSSPVSITVTGAGGPPVILSQSQRLTVTEGSDVTFSLKAVGAAPLSYQWQQGGNDLTDDGHFRGTATATLTILGAAFEDAGVYTVTVSNTHGSVTSEEINLNVEDESLFVRRLLPGRYIPGQKLTVILTATPLPGTTVYAVEDSFPPEWLVSSVEGGTIDLVTHKVKFGPFFDGKTRSFSYTIVPPLSAVGSVDFTGNASADGAEVPIGGDNFMDTLAESVPHPADLDADNRMTINEVTTYGLAWRTGDSWFLDLEQFAFLFNSLGIPFNPITLERIPIEYVTRAAALWKGGEAYHFDRRFSPPLCWVNETTKAAALSLVRTESTTSEKISSISPLASANSTAIRMLPASYTPGQPITVSIPATPATGVIAYAVEDQPPMDWIVANISDDGVFDAVNHRVKWGPFFDNSARTLSYQASSPQNTSGTASFDGVASFDGINVAITGQGQTSSGNIQLELRFASSPILLRGAFRFILTGPAVRTNVIETSTNLVSWTVLTNVFNGTGTLQFSDPAATNLSRRFYRAVQP